MKMLQTMSLSGSVVVIFYVVIKLWGRKAFTYSFYKKMLVLAMVFFLFPFPEFMYLYADLLRTIFPLEEWGLTEFLPHVEWGKPIENYIEYTKDGQFRINHPGFYVFTLICLFLMLVLLVRYIYQSQKARKGIVQKAEQVKWEGINKQFNELKNNMQVKEGVELRASEDINSPITMGVRKPVIFLPKHTYDEEKMSFMLAHELNHVKHKDMFLTIVCYAILMLNFYNPFAYYLFYEWKRIVELSCDEKVMEYMTDDERKKYGLLLVDMAEKETFVQPTYVLGFARKKLIAERVENVISKRKMNTWKKVIAVCLMFIVSFSTSLTVFAYKPDIMWEVDELGDSETEIVFLTDEMFEEFKLTRWVEIDGEKVTYQTKGYEKEFVYIDDEQVIVEEHKDVLEEERETCQHIYVNGIDTEHEKKDEGGCVTTYYSVVKCKICKDTKSKTLYNTETSTLCDE